MVVMKSYDGDLGGEIQCGVSATGKGGNYAAKYASRQGRERHAAGYNNTIPAKIIQSQTNTNTDAIQICTTSVKRNIYICGTAMYQLYTTMPYQLAKTNTITNNYKYSCSVSSNWTKRCHVTDSKCFRTLHCSTRMSKQNQSVLELSITINP